MKTKSPLLSIGVAALSAYGVYYGAGEFQRMGNRSETSVEKVSREAYMDGGNKSSQPPLKAVTPPLGTVAGGSGNTNKTGGSGKVPDRPAGTTVTTHTATANRKQAVVVSSGTSTGTSVVPPAIPPVAKPDPLIATVRRMSNVTGQANAQRDRWKAMTASLAASGLFLSSKIQIPLNQMSTSLDSAEAAIRSGDANAANQYLDDAQKAIGELDAEWERRRPKRQSDAGDGKSVSTQG